MAEQARKLTGAAAAAANGKELAGRLNVLAAGLVDRGLANDGEEFDPVAVALEKLDDAIGQVGQLERKLTAQKAAATRARNQAASVEAQLPAKPRVIGPVDKPLGARDLLMLVEVAETVEVAFSDGKTEILALKPREIHGGKIAFTIGGRGLVLNVPDFTVHGPRAGETPYVLAGYGLYLDGELAAYGARTEPLKIAAGAQYNLKGDPVF